MKSFDVETKVFTNGDIEYFGRYLKGKVTIGSFLLTKKIVKEGEILILESIEIDSAFRGKGFSKILTEEIRNFIFKIKNSKTLCFALEIFPFRYSPLSSDSLQSFYKKEFDMEYIGDRLMVKEYSLNKELFKENYSFIFE